MDGQSPSPVTLDQVRQKIDEIDAALLGLLRDRFAASVTIKELKAASGQTASSPMRPAREAIVLRRLIAACSDPLPVALMLRLWREIISGSTLIQADATVHCSKATLAAQNLRDLIKSHFCQIPIIEHNTDEEALSAAAGIQATVAILAPGGAWSEAIDADNGPNLSVIGALPFFGDNGRPDLLICGLGFDEPTGQDETLLLSTGHLPRDFTPAPLWELEATSGEWLTSLPGFLSASETPLVGLRQGNDALALRVLGRYPSPIKIDM